MQEPSTIGARVVSNTPRTSDCVRIEQRCHVCRDEVVRRSVNELLSIGLSYAGIKRTLAEDQVGNGVSAGISVDSIRRHADKHFAVQSAARATYREIVERRALENGIDFVDGVATAITPMAMFEAVMQKAFANLVEEATTVSVETGLRAAEKLYEISREKSNRPDIGDIMLKVDQITRAVKAVVPEEMWGAIADELDRYEDLEDS